MPFLSPSRIPGVIKYCGAPLPAGTHPSPAEGIGGQQLTISLHQRCMYTFTRQEAHSLQATKGQLSAAACPRVFPVDQVRAGCPLGYMLARLSPNPRFLLRALPNKSQEAEGLSETLCLGAR